MFLTTDRNLIMDNAPISPSDNVRLLPIMAITEATTMHIIINVKLNCASIENERVFHRYIQEIKIPNTRDKTEFKIRLLNPISDELVNTDMFCENKSILNSNVSCLPSIHGTVLPNTLNGKSIFADRRIFQGVLFYQITKIIWEKTPRFDLVYLL